jgi:predicted nucleic acid-binding protein
LRFLLDTNIVTEASKPRPNARLMNWLLAHELASGVPSIVIAERYKGAHDAPKEKRVRLLAEVDHFVHTFAEASSRSTRKPRKCGANTFHARRSN